MSNVLNLLKKVHFLQPLNTKELYELINASFLKEYYRGNIIASEHSYVRGVPIILKGVVEIKLINQDKGKEAFLYFLKEGSTCATTISAGLFKEKIELKVVAVTDVEILFVPIDFFSGLLKQHPEIFEILLHDYYKIFRQLIQSMSSIAFDGLEERLRKLLHHKVDVLGTNEIETTHEELAKELGSSREVITRLMKELEQQNLIKIYRGRVEIINEKNNI